MGIRPAFGDQPAVPGQQGTGSHAEGSPGRTGEQATEGGQQGTIGGFVSGMPHLAPEDRPFMAQGEKLDLLRLLEAQRQKERSNMRRTAR